MDWTRKVNPVSGYPWSASIERAVGVLGHLVRKLSIS